MAIKDSLERLNKLFDRVIVFIIVSLVVLMLLVAISQIVLRQLGVNLDWAPPLLRHAVMLLTFLAASLASGARQNIKIDFLIRLVPAKARFWLERLIDCCVLGVLLVLFDVSSEFWLMEKMYGRVQFLGIHSSWLVFLLPCGLSVLFCRVFLSFLNAFFQSTSQDRGTEWTSS